MIIKQNLLFNDKYPSISDACKVPASFGNKSDQQIVAGPTPGNCFHNSIAVLGFLTLSQCALWVWICGNSEHRGMEIEK